MKIAIAIKILREKVVSAINESQLPPSVVEPILNAIYMQIAQAAAQEVEQAEKEVTDNG